jgi:hypothetical protein
MTMRCSAATALRRCCIGDAVSPQERHGSDSILAATIAVKVKKTR